VPFAIAIFTLCPKILVRNGNTLSAKKRQLIKVAALKNDLIVPHVKKTAPSHANGIAPFKHCPLTVLEQIFNDASHFGAAEFDLEHMTDLGATAQRVGDNLVVDGIGRVEVQQTLDAAAVEQFHPFCHELLRSHGGTSIEENNG
jgi:hypothetical protein